MIRAITFDLWDTLVVDDSDEPIRAGRGLPSKADARRALFVDEVLAHHPAIGRARADEAFDHANAVFRHQWKVEHRTPIGDRLREGFTFLGIDPTPGFRDMVYEFATMEVNVPPRPCEGVEDCLRALAGRYRLGIISDAIVTPGAGLRDILERYGLKDYFDVFIFSDEAGASKPAERVFDLACAGLGVRPHELVHVGDREYNDIAGPLDYGARSILYTGAIDRGSDSTRASAICRHYDEMPGILASLD